MNSHPDHACRMRQLEQKLSSRFRDPTTNCLKVKVKKLENSAIIPTKANSNDAGWDLYALEDVVIKGEERKVVRTGISFEIPEGYVGLIWPRSGLAVKRGIDVLAGVIDSGYRGEIMVCLLNTEKALPLFKDQVTDLLIKRGDRIAQIIFQQFLATDLVEVENLSDSNRGENGFGSSGV